MTKLSPEEITREKRRERERIKQIVSNAPSELREQALQLALTTDLPVEEVAQRLLAKVPPGLFQGNDHTEQPGSSVWSKALKLAAERRESRRRR